MRWNEIFTRSSIGPNVFQIKSSEKSSLLLSGAHDHWNAIHRICTGAGIPAYEEENIVDLNTDRWSLYCPFLDGGFTTITRNDHRGLRGSWIIGFEALRFVLFRLGIQQPRRFKYEACTAPSPALMINKIHHQLQCCRMEQQLLELKSVFALHNYIREMFLTGEARNQP